MPCGSESVSCSPRRGPVGSIPGPFPAIWCVESFQPKGLAFGYQLPCTGVGVGAPKFAGWLPCQPVEFGPKALPCDACDGVLVFGVLRPAWP